METGPTGLLRGPSASNAQGPCPLLWPMCPVCSPNELNAVPGVRPPPTSRTRGRAWAAASGPRRRSTSRKSPNHRARERLRVVRQPHVLAVRDRQPLGADGRGHDRFPHRHGFEDLQARAAADPERHDVHGRVPHIRPDIVDAAGDDDAVLPGQGGHRRRRRAADDRQRHVRLLAADERQHLPAEEQHRVFVGKPVHRAGEHQRPAPGGLDARLACKAYRCRHRSARYAPAGEWRPDTAAGACGCPPRRPRARRRSGPACDARIAACAGTACRREDDRARRSSSPRGAARSRIRRCA